ncbi:MAG: hypothetical protein ABRQ37_00390 [Candidatus Eremiobacterota bacterium]
MMITNNPGSKYENSHPCHKRCYKKAIAPLFPYITAILLSSLILTLLLNLWKADLAIPFGYTRDVLDLHATVFKSITDKGWYITNDSIGMPQGLFMQDMLIPMNLHCFFIKIFSFFSKSSAVIMNFYYLISFLFITITSLYVLLRFNISAPVAVIISLLFTFLPYHFFRGEAHIFLGAYYMIPLTVMVMLDLSREPLILYRQNYSTIARYIIICILAGCDFVYYPFFMCYFLLCTGIIYSLYARRMTYLLNSLILIAIISITVFISLIPTMTYRLQNGVNTEAGVRPLSEGEEYGLKITQLLLPVTCHRIPYLAHLKNTYKSTAPLVNENDFATLGLIGSAGFLFLLKELLYGKKSNPLITSLSLLNLLAILLATVGGFGSLFNYIICPQIRSYNRISIYIAFFSLFAIALLLNEVYRKHINYLDKLQLYVTPLNLRAKKIGFYIFITFILIAGILDQTIKGFTPDYNGTKSEYMNDQNFVEKIENSTSKNAMIFQLPYVPYPEWPPVNKMTDYSHFKGYIHSKNLRWSYGAMRGREGDLWQKAISEKPVNEFLDILAFSGFSGIYIDRYGYADSGSEIETKLSSILAIPPMISDNKRLSFFNIEPYGKKLREKYTEKEWDMKQYESLHQLLLSWEKGFYYYESDAVKNWRWCSSEGELHITNTSKNNKKITLNMSVVTDYKELSDLKLESDLFTDTIKVNSSDAVYSKEITVTPGKHIIKFSCDAERAEAPGDDRFLVFRVINFKVIEQE